ncbi:hypothetical protein HUT11_20660 [Streptomyces seoulensis]|nr:hypothetical protein HUT11_20660 [Streptomyces seoulensis]
MINRVRTWAVARRRAREEKVTSELRESLDHLGLSQPVPECVEAALRNTARSQWVTVLLSALSLFAMWFWIGWSFSLAWEIGREVVGVGNGLTSIFRDGPPTESVDRLALGG